MEGNTRNSTYARIGRSYPRPSPDNSQAPRRRASRHYRVTGVVIALLSALGLIGWLLAR